MPDRVVSLDLGCQPAYSGSAELVLQGIERCVVLFLAIGTQKNEEGYLPDKGIGVVEFTHFSVARTGYPNDEGRPEHPLWPAGLSDRDTNICEVLDSTWLEELDLPSGGHRHFVFCFKEGTLEVAASDLTVETSSLPYEQVAAAALARVLKD